VCYILCHIDRYFQYGLESWSTFFHHHFVCEITVITQRVSSRTLHFTLLFFFSQFTMNLFTIPITIITKLLSNGEHFSQEHFFLFVCLRLLHWPYVFLSLSSSHFLSLSSKSLVNSNCDNFTHNIHPSIHQYRVTFLTKQNAFDSIIDCVENEIFWMCRLRNTLKILPINNKVNVSFSSNVSTTHSIVNWIWTNCPLFNHRICQYFQKFLQCFVDTRHPMHQSEL
jgi:hypothetical protein